MRNRANIASPADQPDFSAMHPIATPRLQAKRREILLARHRAASRSLFNDNGSYAEKDRKVDPREWCWYALAFIQGDLADIQLANAMLRRTLKDRIDDQAGHFWCCLVTSLLSRFGDRVEPQLRDRLLIQLGASIARESAQRFRGYNDNFPAMAALTVLVGGRLCGKREFDDAGLACLQSLKSLLSRRGLLSEYTSPNYTPITLTCLAEIVELCDIDEARDMARIAEARVWLDLCSRFFPPTASLAGPHSRAYAADLCGHFLKAHTCFYQVFGEEFLPVNPLNTAYADPRGRVLHEGRSDFVQRNIAWQAMPTYHIPPAAVNLVVQRRPEIEVRGSSEQAAFARNAFRPVRYPSDPLGEFAAGECHTYTYQNAAFALGHADRTFLDGFQHSPLHLTYTRPHAKRPIDRVVTLFPRFIIGDRQPDPLRHHLYDEGRALCAGERGAAMALYRGRPAWGGDCAWPDYATTPAASLRLAILVTCFASEPEQLWLGETRLSGWSGESQNPEPIFIAEPEIYIAIHPLIQTDLGRGAAVRVSKQNGFGMISLMNYEGPPRTFDDATLATCMNGLVLEVALRSDWDASGGFNAFRAAQREARIVDRFSPGDAMRHVRYARPGGVSIEMDVSPVSDGIRFALVNDRPPRRDAFSVTGLGPQDVPWLVRA